MKKRLYFLLPNVESANKAVDELLLARIPEHSMHVMAKEGVDLGNLPEASIFQKTDIVHSIELGMIVGGLAGLVASAMFIFQLEVVMGVIILGCTLFGAIFGIWVSAMIATSIKNTRLEKFERSMQNGKILLMVDVRKDQLTVVNRKMKISGQVVFGGEEQSMPAFP